MEPVTHFLPGACIGRSGLNRKTRYATVVARGAGEAASLLPAFREAMQRAAPDVAFRFGTFEETMLGSLGERRFTLRIRYSV